MIPTVKSERFGIIRSTTVCHACKQSTPVSGLCVSGGRYRDEPGDVYWYPIDGLGLLRYIQSLDPVVLDTWRTAASWIKYMPSRTAGISYWSNTCVHCGALQGDWFLTEADGPFFPTTADREALVTMDWAAGGLSAVADISESSWLDRLAARHPAEADR